MAVAQSGDRVTIHYIGTLDNGTIFDSADEDNPLSFTIGQGEVFPALEAAITGMGVGNAKNVEISTDQAYGERIKDNIITVPADQFPTDRTPQVGEKVSVTFADDNEQVLGIIECKDGNITLDGNHPLAGHDLTFALELVSIVAKQTH